MDKVIAYKGIIQEELSCQASSNLSNTPELKQQLIFDEERTDIVLVDKLIEKGIPKSAIVPSFLPVYEREDGEYAVA